MKRSLFPVWIIGLSVASLLFSACGGGGGGSEEEEQSNEIFLQQIQGEWVSDEINFAGEKTRIVFTVDALGQQNFTLESFKQTASQNLTSPIDDGTFSGQVVQKTVSGVTTYEGALTLDFKSGTEITSDIVIGSGILKIDDSEFRRAGGGTVIGQIRIDDGTSDAGTGSLGTSSAVTRVARSEIKVRVEPAPEVTPLKAPPTEPVRLLVKRAGSGYERIVIPAPPLEAATRGEKAVSPSFAERADAAVAAYRNLHPGALIFVDQRMGLQEVVIPNDPLYEDQWGMRSINAVGGWQIAGLIDNSDGSADTVVAVIDTGKATNADLTPQWVPGHDFISEIVDPDSEAVSYPGGDGDGRDADPTDLGDNFFGIGQHSWHGNHLAGIIGAVPNNGQGIAGVNPYAKIRPLRVIGEGGGSILDIAEAVRYAAGLAYDLQDDDSFAGAEVMAPRAKVINLSLGCTVVANDPALSPLTYQDVPVGSSGAKIIPTCDISNSAVAAAIGFLNEAIQGALTRGVVVVAAAGNCNAFTDACAAPFYPADLPGVIKVGGIKNDTEFAHFLSVEGNNFIAAPSGWIEACGSVGMVPQITSTLFNSWGCRVGTSQAAAFVSGAVSLLLSIKPDLTVDQVKTLLQGAAFDLGPDGLDPQYGHGLLNVRDAALAAASLSGLSVAGLPAASALFSHEELHFGETKTEKKVIVSNAGGGTVGGVNATSSANWLTVAVSQGTAPAIVTFTVNRGGVAPGTYQTTVTISTDSGSQGVAVTMAVPQPTTQPAGDTTADDDEDGEVDSFEDFLEHAQEVLAPPSYNNTTDIGTLIVLLINKNESDPAKAVVAGVETSLEVNYNFNFSGLANGDYYVIAGKVNSQGKICDLVNTPELACAAYPSYETPAVLTIQGNNTVDNVTLGL